MYGKRLIAKDTVPSDHRFIEATSQTKWSEVPPDWREVATQSVVDAGHGSTEMCVVAIITSALWETFGDPNYIGR